MVDVVVVGSFVQDFAFRTERFPSPGESRIGGFATGPGGKGFNQAVACSRQRTNTLFIGACGDDMFGAEAQRFARKEGLTCAFEVIPDVPSGAASIVIDDAAQNQIVVALGANDGLSVAHVEQQREAIAKAHVVVSQLESAADATAEAFATARMHGAITVLNPAPINSEMKRETLSLVDVLTPNETEFAFLAKHLLGTELTEQYWTHGHPDLHHLCRRFDVPAVVITLGADGCFVSLSDALAEKTGSEPWYTMSAAAVRAIDTTGAGDAFTGGLASALSAGGLNGLREAVEQANRVAGLSTEKPGTAPAMPTRDEVVARFGRAT